MVEDSSQSAAVQATATPLLAPVGGVPKVVESESEFENALAQLAQGSGPFALDTERASGYKYSARAYLIQVKRTNGGLHLIDPIPFGPHHPLFLKFNELLNTDEVILHASTQDLPCLRELGINPTKLFDTELGGRIAGLPRVGLGPLLESQMGVLLAKEHSSVDWSTRPLPQDWLNYAALDVELLVELRDRIYELLDSAGKLQWAMQDFAAILVAPPTAPRVDPWRRTSGIHKIKKRQQLAVVRALWNVRNELAQEADIAPSRLLSDNAISALAVADSAITNRKHLEKVLKPIGLRARWIENAATWISAITDAITMDEDSWPQVRSNTDALPPIKLWRDRFPERYAPLTHARAQLDLKATELNIPLENLISPEAVRRICWNKPLGEVSTALAALGVRPWQIEIAAPLLEAALLEVEPLEILEPATEGSAEESSEE
jgi:ribonuclease D